MPWRNLVHTKKELPSREPESGTLPAGSTEPSTGVLREHSVWTTTSPAASYHDPRGEYGAFISTVKGDQTEKGLSRESPFQILVTAWEGDLGIPNGKYTYVQYVEFVQLHEPSLTWLPVENFQRRTTWMVGIASNLRNTTKPNSVNVGQWATHWGVYILPKTATTDVGIPRSLHFSKMSNDLQEYPYRIYGLNFSGKNGKTGRDDDTVLIVGQNWATNRGYVKNIAASEFTRVTEPVEMHFAHDEFILTGKLAL